MVCGCIDIGSNTTRVLVAEASGGQLRELLQRRAFTRIGKGLKPGAEIPRAKIEEVAGVVASHRELAEQVGADPVRTVATAAIRGAIQFGQAAGVAIVAAVLGPSPDTVAVFHQAWLVLAGCSLASAVVCMGLQPQPAAPPAERRASKLERATSTSS